MSKDYKIKVTDKLKNEQGFDSIRKFFKQVIENFAKESFNFYEEWGEFPFVYRERQVNSALIPAIYKYTNTIWLEQPFKKTNKKQRFLDIVTTDKNNIYFIELKHSFTSKTKKIDERSIHEWDTAIKQISTIKMRTLGRQYNSDSKMFKIALMIMPTYLLSSEIDAEVLHQQVNDYNKKVFDYFTDEGVWTKKGYANLIGTIKIVNPLDFKHDWGDKNEVYPFVSFVARIEKLQED